jgi:OPA family glycerol-3-phosphate transporter-like MFS transporter
VEDIRPDLQATAWGLFGLSVRVMILFLLIFATRLYDSTGSWHEWLIIALVANAAFIPAVFFFGGNWRRPRPVAAVAAESEALARAGS